MTFAAALRIIALAGAGASSAPTAASASASHLSTCSAAGAIDAACVLRALSTDGAVVLSEVRGLAAARAEGLCAAAACAEGGSGGGNVDDGSVHEVALLVVSFLKVARHAASSGAPVLMSL